MEQLTDGGPTSDVTSNIRTAIIGYTPEVLKTKRHLGRLYPDSPKSAYAGHGGVAVCVLLFKACRERVSERCKAQQLRPEAQGKSACKPAALLWIAEHAV
eukprot:611035-Pelagomonas_calceolata.AAC.1